MGRIFKRSDGTSYFAQFKGTSGRWIKRSTGCTDRRAAQLVLARFEREAQQRGSAVRTVAHDASDPSSVPTDQATLDGVLRCLIDTAQANGKADGTVVMYAQKAGHLVRVLGHELDVNTLTLATVQRFVNQRRAEGAALSTVNKELITLRAALSLARQHGVFFGGDVIPKLNMRYVPHERYLTPDEFRALILELDPPRALWVAVAVFTGGRLSEVAKLDWSDISWGVPATVRIRGTKTVGSGREIPVADPLARLLFPVRQASGPVVGAWPNCRRDLTAACKRAGIASVSPNDLRRTFASWMKQHGVDSAVVARLLGHSSTKMVDLVYGRLNMATLAQAVAVFGGQSRDKGGTKRSVRGGSNGKRRAAEVPVFPLDLVLGPGIEPGTRGFSIRAYSDPSARYVEKYLDQDYGTGQGRDKELRLTSPRRR